MSREKQITKVIVYYTDGTYEEVATNPVAYPVDSEYMYDTNLELDLDQPVTITIDDLKAWEDQWKELYEKYEAGQEDSGK